MSLSPQTKIKLGQISIITLVFILINVFIAFFNISLLNSPYSLGPTSIFDPMTHIILNILIGIIAGILGGLSLIFVYNRYFRKKSFRYAIIMTLTSYIAIFIFIITVILIILISLEMDETKQLSDVILNTLKMTVDLSTITYFVLWGTITIITLFALQINDKFGPGNLKALLTGKYNQPIKEERIFMFLDMRSSTRIAEKLGNEGYFNLLRDVFSDITNTILDHEGDIYQYVGDEIVISWTMPKGIRNANCLNCFTQIQNTLTGLSETYEGKYSIVPEFKAGIHHGWVMAGEIGVVKKDIIYSGDVLNTTARIQDQCNHYNVDILVSKKTYDIIEDKDDFESNSIGSIELRGKEDRIEILTVIKK